MIKELITTYVDLRGGLANMSTDEKKALVELGESGLSKESVFGPLPYPISPDDVVFTKKGPRRWESHGVDMVGNGRTIGEIRKIGRMFKMVLGEWAATRCEFAELPNAMENSLSAIKNKVRRSVA